MDGVRRCATSTIRSKKLQRTLAMAGDRLANMRSTHVTLSFSVSSGGGFGEVTVMCIANAAVNMKGILSKDIITVMIFSVGRASTLTRQTKVDVSY